MIVGVGSILSHGFIQYYVTFGLCRGRDEFIWKMTTLIWKVKTAHNTT